jgi:nucleoid DNA-binding protein
MFEKTGYQKASLTHILQNLPECLVEALEKDKSIQINGIGTFSVRVRKARIARNPKDGSPVNVPEKMVVHFKMHNSLKTHFQEVKK